MASPKDIMCRWCFVDAGKPCDAYRVIDGGCQRIGVRRKPHPIRVRDFQIATEFRRRRRLAIVAVEEARRG